MMQPPYPIHESLIEQLDSEYIDYYNANLIDKQQSHHQPVADSRTRGDLIPGSGPKLTVEDIIDISIPSSSHSGTVYAIRLRCFVPLGDRPAAGWPVVIYLHSGGWVLGNLDTENTICTHICARADCMVFTVDYRLAPEHIYPAAVEDCWEAIMWIADQGVRTFGLDLSRVIIMGSSAGANLAATVSHRAVKRDQEQQQLKLCQQILIVPVLDNTALPCNNDTYRRYEFGPGLPAQKMLWYRRHYLPDESKWRESSPLHFEDGWDKLPKTLVVVGELDVLRSEGEQYAAKLKKNGVAVSLRIVHGMPHAFFAMDGVLQKARDTLGEIVGVITSAIQQ